MSATGVKRAKAVTERESLEPAFVYRAEPDSKEWQAQRLVRLWNVRRAPLLVFTVCVAASLIIPFLIPNTYKATSQLMPPDSMSNSGMAVLATLAAKAGPLGAVSGDLFNVKTTAGLFIGVMGSQNLLGHLVKQFDLAKVYHVKDEDEAAVKLNERTAIREDKNSGLIAVSVTDRDPKLAAAIANAYVDNLNSLLAELSTSSAHRERVFLEDRLKVVKEELDKATGQLAQFSSNTDTLDPQAEGKAMLDAAGNITAQLVASEAQLEGLREIYTDRHPRVKALNARVEQLRKELQKLGGVPNGAARQKTSEPLQAGDSSSSTAYPSMRSLPLLGATYSDYYRHLKIEESVFEQLTTQYELAKVQEAKELPAIKILDVAKPPRKKAWPHRPLLMLLGIVLSFGVATICWLLAMTWNEIDPLDPRLVVIYGFVGQVRAQLPWSSPEENDRETHREVVSSLRRGHQGSNDETFD
jgi:uncharacterized protein involved in exopolysaccharide biosynthesis